MAFHLSMSRSALLLECTYGFSVEPHGSGESSEDARYGSAFHELLAKLVVGEWDPLRSSDYSSAVLKWRLTERTHDELTTHVPNAAAALKVWLGGKNAFGIDFSSGEHLVEQSMALLPRAARVIPAPTADTHEYEDAVPGEIPGTADLITVPPRRKKVPLLLLDYKTGEGNFSRPLTPQILSLAAAATRIYPGEGIIAGILHARRRGMPIVYAERIEEDMLDEHVRRLFAQHGRIGDGYMRPGQWCVEQFCPARTVCPARDAELLARSGDVLAGLVAAGGALSGASGTMVPAGAPTSVARPKKLGALYRVIQQAEALAKRARDEIRAEVAAGALPETPDGKYIVLRTFSRENLSKSSVERAYGRAAGAKVLAKLRRDGAIESKEVTSLAVEEDQ